MVVHTHGSTRQRILAATAEVLGRNGRTKLSLSEVALQAGVSRPTLYRWFDSKKDLLDAFVVWERQSYERAVADATAALPASEKLDATLRVVAEYQQSYPGLRMIDVEPAHVIKRLSQVLPLMRGVSHDSGRDRTATSPRPRPSGWRYRTTWCEATTATSSWPNCATPRGSGPTRPRDHGSSDEGAVNYDLVTEWQRRICARVCKA
jgi:AcrR family transcriptional regulator